MIKKIIEIKNVGIFKSMKLDDGKWNKEFRKVNLVFSRNGQGKTTLTEIMNSLKNNDVNIIKARKTLGQSEDAKIKLLLNGKMVAYENNAWSESFDKIEIFNSKFVYDNLYTGENVETEHQKNLHSFIIGSKGVELTKDILDIDRLIKNINTQISEQKSEINVKTNGFDIDKFVALQKIENIESEIKKTDKEIEIQNKKDEILKKSELTNINVKLPMHETLKKILNMGFSDISKIAEDQIKDHANKNCKGKIHNLIQEGLRVFNGKNCPFCGQDVSTIDLIVYYQDFFSKAYQEFRHNINLSLKEVSDSLEEKQFSNIEIIALKNQQLHEYWLGINSTLPQLESNLQFIQDNISKAKEYISKDIANKKENILDLVQINDETEFFLEQIKLELNKYNLKINEINELIRTEKGTAGRGDIAELRMRKKNLELVKLRHYDNAIVGMCRNYNNLIKEKTRLTSEKTKKRQELDLYSETFMKDFKEDLNKQLERFGAGFRIMNSSLDYKGGQPKVDYRLEINRCEVPLRVSKIDVPCFKNTLSEGDKTTLAFAFFVCKLKSLSDLNDRIIVIDDPITSLDFFRITQTVSELNRLASTAGQTFLFTHNEMLAKKFYDVSLKQDFYELEINNGCIRRLEIDSITSIDYFKNYSILESYLNGAYDGDEISVARCIRPLLEGYLRVRYPKYFKANEWLGDFIKFIRNSDVASLKLLISELEDINEYSKKFHHEDGVALSIDSNELRSFSSRTIEFLLL